MPPPSLLPSLSRVKEKRSKNLDLMLCGRSIHSFGAQAGKCTEKYLFEQGRTKLLNQLFVVNLPYQLSSFVGQNASAADQLSLALIWNREDIAKSEIFTEDQKWDVSC